MTHSNITINEIAERLTAVFHNNIMRAEYFNTTGILRQGVCGWCGVMAPLSRPAFVEDFGEDTIKEAERMAHAANEKNLLQYSGSNYHRHELAADAQGVAVPAVGSFVWAVCSNMKCDGGDGLHGEIDAMERYADASNKKRLCKVAQVFEVSADEFARPSLADELVERATKEGGEFPGGSATDDPDTADKFDKYRFWFTICAAVVCPESGRWFLIDSEGYSYARYIYMPTNWREMFAVELAAIDAQIKAEQEEAERREAERKAKAAADYAERCNKWARLMQEIEPLEEKARAAYKSNGWRSKEYKDADRAITTARRRNLAAMSREAFPGLKMSIKKSDYYAYEIEYTDGPTRDEFDTLTDYPLFVSGYDHFDGYTDSTEYIRKEFTEFADKYLHVMGDIKIRREMSEETRARLVALIMEAVPACTDATEWRVWSYEEIESISKSTGADFGRLLEDSNSYNSNNAESLANILFKYLSFYKKPEPPNSPTDPNGGSTKDTQTAEKSEGLSVSEYSERATVVRGYNDEQRAELLAMGGRENYRLQGGRGVIFSTRKHGDALQIWKNEQDRKARAAELGEGWQWNGWDTDTRARVGDTVCSVSGLRWVVTKTPDGCTVFFDVEGKEYAAGAVFVNVAARTNEPNETESAPALLFESEGEQFHKGDRVILSDVYQSDRRDVVGFLTGKEKDTGTVEVTTEGERVFYGWMGSVKHIESTTPNDSQESNESNEPEGISTRPKRYTFQDKAHNVPDDMPANVRRFYLMNENASDEKPAPVCFFYNENAANWDAFGSDAFILRDMFGALVLDMTTETEYKNGRKYPQPLSVASVSAKDLRECVEWLNREGYATAVFINATAQPVINDGLNGPRCTESAELPEGITRTARMIRNVYDGHHDLTVQYRKGSQLLACYFATGQDGEKWEYISSLRPLSAGTFSNGKRLQTFGTLWEAEKYLLQEIKGGELQPYQIQGAA